MSSNLGNGSVTFGDASIQSTAYTPGSQFGLQTEISSLTRAGHGCMGMLYKGKLIVAKGNNTFAPYGAGVGTIDSGITSLGILNGLQPVPFPPGEIGTIVKFNIGYAVSFALLSNGNLYTWGNNNYGACGLGHTTRVNTPTLASTSVTDVFSVKGSGYAANSRLFMLKTGIIYACGYNGYGQLGIGNVTASIPAWTRVETSAGVNITGITDVVSIGNDFGHTFFINSTRTVVYACGLNNTGQLGNNTITNQSYALNVSANWGLSATISVTKITGGAGASDGLNTYSGGFTVMLLSNKNVFTSGNNQWGTLGNGTVTNSAVPVAPTGVNVADIVDIAAFGGVVGTVYALTSTGSLWTWGYNEHGQCGSPVAGAKTTPTAPAGGVTNILCDGFDSYLNSWYSTGFIKAGGFLYTAGYNGAGQCGVGTITTANPNFTRVLLPSASNFTGIGVMGQFTTTAGGHIYAIATDDNKLYAWGYNGNHGLDYSNHNYMLTPGVCKLPLGI